VVPSQEQALEQARASQMSNVGPPRRVETSSSGRAVRSFKSLGGAQAVPDAATQACQHVLQARKGRRSENQISAKDKFLDRLSGDRIIQYGVINDYRNRERDV
jgi:hypothetical protein